MDIRLDHKNAVVCGSTQGIGKAIAIELAGLGANVFLLARNEASLKKTLNELPKESDQKHGYAIADFNHPEEVNQAIGQLLEDAGDIHILVNNSGGPPPGLASEATSEDFELAFRRHLVNNQQLVQAFVPGMKKAAYGRIINVISTSVKAPIPNLGVSNTIRGAVASWAKTISNELGGFGITVNNILPGLTHTARLESLIEQNAQNSGVSIEEMAKKMKSEIPAGRFADPEETAALAGFLAGPSAAYINGTSIRVDGGKTPSI
ncbi:MAG TPA: short-chain dehydrogenase [Cytophagales bacterium]|jgi:3-oxoacyl-[acyl-carrier protein] reductase|nr:short-chain dehydrogenase [Cytophagales bacterium]